MEEDIRDDTTNRLFYFGHFFDPHAPYLPPPPYRVDDKLNIDEIFNFRDAPSGEYLDRYNAETVTKNETYEQVLNYYNTSANYTANQIVKLFDYMKSVDIFDEALIILTGDHGEEFGERGFYGHNSLYDANIRPFMTIKPPESADWPSAIEAVDHIDILPTIASLLDADIPSQCQGTPIQQKSGTDEPRVTERIRPDSYNISVELEGIKAIFTYPDNYPYRPTDDTVEQGPILEEYYRRFAVRKGDYSDIGDQITDDVKSELKQIAHDFMNAEISSGAHYTPAEIEQETEELLQDLGYM
jgi:arylsulfatase A-like enzyme